MGQSSSSPAENGTYQTTRVVGKDIQGRRGRKSTSTEATARVSTTSLLSGDFEPSATFEVTRVMEDDVINEENTSSFDDSDDEESDDEEDEKGEYRHFRERSKSFPLARNSHKRSFL